jgi:hypothetical protein
MAGLASVSWYRTFCLRFLSHALMVRNLIEKKRKVKKNRSHFEEARWKGRNPVPTAETEEALPVEKGV